MSTLKIECMSIGMAERIISAKQEIYSHVEFISFNNAVLTLAVLA